MNYLGNGITLVDAHYTAKGVAGIYILEHKGKCAIIETGTSKSLKYILAELKNLNLRTQDVLYVIATHVHLDHAGGAGSILKKCSNAKLIIHPFGAKHMIDPSRLIEGTKIVYGADKFNKLYGSIYPIAEDRIIEADDGFRIDINGRELLFIDTPGHASHHFCVYDELSNGIFSGDTFGISYPQLNDDDRYFIFATSTPVQFKPEKLLNSIDKLLSLKPKYFYLTHFGRIKNTSQAVDILKKTIYKYIDIALSCKNIMDNRAKYIENEMYDYLLQELTNFSYKLSKKKQKAIIKTDVELNSQGLDYWLNKIQ